MRVDKIVDLPSMQQAEHRRPGGKMGLAMQLIFTPMILQLMDKSKKAAREPVAA